MLTGFVLLAASCGDPFAPPEQVHPEIEWFLVSGMLEDGGFLDLRAEPLNFEFRLARNQSVPVEVVVSSGDREELGLKPMFCRGHDPELYRLDVVPFRCFNFGIRFEQDFDFEEIARRAERIGGRARVEIVIGETIFGSVTLFSQDDVIGHTRRAASWPGVESTFRDGPAFCFDICINQIHWLQLPVPVEVAAPTSDDGIVQLRPGDTITVRYVQPGGEVLETVEVVP